MIAQEQRRRPICDPSRLLSLAVDFLRATKETMDKPHQFYLMSGRAMLAALWAMHGSQEEAGGGPEKLTCK